jgi:hypothetical protein
MIMRCAHAPPAARRGATAADHGADPGITSRPVPRSGRRHCAGARPRGRLLLPLMLLNCSTGAAMAWLLAASLLLLLLPLICSSSTPPPMGWMVLRLASSELVTPTFPRMDLTLR